MDYVDPTSIYTKLQTYGLFHKENGVWITTALKFVNPDIAQDSRETRNLSMGKVEVYLHEGIPTGRPYTSTPTKNWKDTFVPAKVDAAMISRGVSGNKKNLRSGQGSERGTLTTAPEILLKGRLLKKSECFVWYDVAFASLLSHFLLSKSHVVVQLDGWLAPGRNPATSHSGLSNDHYNY